MFLSEQLQFGLNDCAIERSPARSLKVRKTNFQDQIIDWDN